MIEIRRRGSFLLKPVQPILVGSVFLTEDLDCNLTSQLHVFGKIDHSHPARAELLENSIVGNSLCLHLPQNSLATKRHIKNFWYSLLLICAFVPFYGLIRKPEKRLLPTTFPQPQPERATGSKTQRWERCPSSRVVE